MSSIGFRFSKNFCSTNTTYAALSSAEPELLDPETSAGTDPDVGLHTQAVRLVLVLLDLSGNLSNFPPLAEVDKVFAVSAQEVRVSLLRLQDVGQIDSCSINTPVRAGSGGNGTGRPRSDRTKEGDAGRVDGAQFSQVLLVVIFTQLMGLLQDLPLPTWDLLHTEAHLSESVPLTGSDMSNKTPAGFQNHCHHHSFRLVL